jgi:hypothetical protein
MAIYRRPHAYLIPYLEFRKLVGSGSMGYGGRVGRTDFGDDGGEFMAEG